MNSSSMSSLYSLGRSETIVHGYIARPSWPGIYCRTTIRVQYIVSLPDQDGPAM
jgi:hypothetical protein